MIELIPVDEQELLALSFKAGADGARSVIAEIAHRHGVDWRGWPTWTCGPLQQDGLLSMAICDFESDSFEPLLQFAFGKFWRDLQSANDVRSLFECLANSFVALRKQDAGPRGIGASQTDCRAKEAATLALVASGQDGVRFAFAALSFALPGSAYGWLDEALAQALANLQAIAIAPPFIAPISAPVTEPCASSGTAKSL